MPLWLMVDLIANSRSYDHSLYIHSCHGNPFTTLASDNLFSIFISEIYTRSRSCIPTTITIAILQYEQRHQHSRSSSSSSSSHSWSRPWEKQEAKRAMSGSGSTTPTSIPPSPSPASDMDTVPGVLTMDTSSTFLGRPIPGPKSVS